MGTYRPVEFLFQYLIILPFNTIHGFSRQEYSCGLPFPSPVDLILETLGMPISSTVVPGGRPASTCLGIWPSKGCHASSCSAIHQFRGPRRSTRLDLPRDPILGRPSCLDLPGDMISRRLSCLSLPRDLHPDPGMPGSQVATVLGKISFRKTHP